MDNFEVLIGVISLFGRNLFVHDLIEETLIIPLAGLISSDDLCADVW